MTAREAGNWINIGRSIRSSAQPLGRWLQTENCWVGWWRLEHLWTGRGRITSITKVSYPLVTNYEIPATIDRQRIPTYVTDYNVQYQPAVVSRQLKQFAHRWSGSRRQHRGLINYANSYSFSAQRGAERQKRVTILFFSNTIYLMLPTNRGATTEGVQGYQGSHSTVMGTPAKDNVLT